MEFFTAEMLTSLLLIIGIDLVLAGDNAIVIALASRDLPKEQQKKAVLWGTIGAVAIRVVATLVLVWLLKIPGLHLIGGLLLLWIAYKLLVDNNENTDIKAGKSLGDAVRTIIVADALMGIDNVLAIAGAAGDHYLLVIIGLAISVPVIVWGSQLFIKLIDRYSWIIYAGAGILAFTSAKMITHEAFLEEFFINYPFLKWAMTAILIAAVIFLGLRKNKKANGQTAEQH